MPQNNLGVAYGKNPAGNFSPLSTDGDGALIVSQGEANTFLAANPSGVTTSAGLATTYVGICLSNPAGSGVNLIVRRVAGQFIVAPSTVTGLGLITGYSAAGIVTHTTPLTPFSRIIGTGPTPKGLVDSACTIVGTPVWTAFLSETLIATDLPSFSVDLAGMLILPPGAYVAVGTTIAGPASGFQGSFSWEETASTET
jgi:hypothetical protein